MLAFMALVAPVLIAVAILAATSVAKPIGRWFTAQLRETFTDAISEIVKPSIDALDHKLDLVQAENRRDHATVVERLDAVEHRLGAVETSVDGLTQSTLKEHS